MKKLSIIIPVYNVEKYIAQCLQSCVKQVGISHDDYEIIVVNDGSPDNSLAIVEEIAYSYLNIIIINQDNRGLSGARNTGMKHSRGEYIWFVDSDDYIQENCLIKIIQKLDNEKPDCLAICAANVVNDNIIRRQSYFNSKTISGIEFLKKGISPCVPFSIWRSSFLRKNNLSFFEGIFHEDSEFSPRAYYLAKKISLINDVCYFVNQNPNSITRTLNPKRSFDLINTVCVQLSKFTSNVLPEHKILFHNLISINLNCALTYIQDCPQLYQEKLSEALFEKQFLFIHLIKSSRIKYKIEGMSFKMFPRNVMKVYNLFQLFNFRR